MNGMFPISLSLCIIHTPFFIFILIFVFGDIDNILMILCSKICFKTYTSVATLNNHMRLHEVSSLFRCEYCGKGFTQNHHLKRHLRIHTGITPFNCRYCDRRFKYKTSMQRHERTVHKDVHIPILGSVTATASSSTVGKQQK